MDEELVQRYNTQVPRYTSYPPTPFWGTVQETTYVETLQNAKGPFSLYLHIPFCRSMCLYCGCHVVLNRKKEKEERYVDALLQEIDLVADNLQGKQEVAQIHFGGGTPTQLSTEQLQRIFTHLRLRFDVTGAKEIAMEIDPRTVFEDGGQKLFALKEMGCNRVSFGVQDTDEKVQEAIKRRQSHQMTYETFYKAKELGFQGINIDLIYGLPYQTRKTFQKTVQDILELSPDRIALFSYAKVPWLKPHQKAIREETLPSTSEKFQIYYEASKAFEEAGYIVLGKDHFAKKDDELAVAFLEGKLHRNFQGYTLRLAESMLSFGVSAIGDVSSLYVQNIKELDSYYAHLEQGKLPLRGGYQLTQEDKLRKEIIHSLMCSFQLETELLSQTYGVVFAEKFQEELAALEPFILEGMLEKRENLLLVTEKGRFFVRNIVSCFDSYYNSKSELKLFSKAI